MAKRTIVTLAVLTALTLLMVSCGGGTGDPTSTDGAPSVSKVKVYTSCFPVDWLTQRVAGGHAELIHILPPGEDPPDWTPPPEVVGQMQGADLIVINGAGFEGWVATTTLPSGKIVDTSAGQALIEVEDTTHSHGKDGEHTHKGTDPHTWSNPSVATAQAATIRDALTKADPANAESYGANFDTLAADLASLDVAYQAACEGYDGQVLATSHPAFNYMARRYGLKVANFGFEPDELPSDEAMEHFRHEAGHQGFTVLLWEAAPSGEVKAAFDACGVTSVFLDPLEQPPGGGKYDYLTQARANVTTLEGLFGETAAQEAAEPPPAE